MRVILKSTLLGSSEKDVSKLLSFSSPETIAYAKNLL